MSPAALEKMESEAASANNSQTDTAAATVDPSEARFSEFCKVFFSSSSLLSMLYFIVCV